MTGNLEILSPGVRGPSSIRATGTKDGAWSKGGKKADTGYYTGTHPEMSPVQFTTGGLTDTPDPGLQCTSFSASAVITAAFITEPRRSELR